MTTRLSREAGADTVVQVVGRSAPGYLVSEMKRRTRLIASGLIALAMTLSFSEAVLASMCAPGLGATVRGTADTRSPRGMPCCGPAAMRDGTMAGAVQNAAGKNSPHSAHAPADSGQSGRGEVPCPFGPVAGAAGCATAASLPAHTFDDLAASPEDAMVLVFDSSQYNPSFANALFHPPKL